jgi:hypothetical protein
MRANFNNFSLSFFFIHKKNMLDGCEKVSSNREPAIMGREKF